MGGVSLFFSKRVMKISTERANDLQTISNEKVIEIIAVWEKIDQHQDESVLYGTIAEIALGSLHTGENITITEMENQSRAVRYFDPNLNKEVEIICALNDRHWIISEVSI